MINHLTMLLGQTQTNEEIVSSQTGGNSVPASALERTGSSWFGSSDYWFPEQASTFGSQVDDLYMAIFWICVFFFVGIIAVMVYFAIRYRRIGNEIKPEPSTSHNTWLEIAWSVLPSLLLVWIFWEGAIGFFDMRIAPDNAEEIQVTAMKWNWKFTYPNGDISSELHLVRDQPVKLVMRSDDVLHSMFIPAFRQKVDIVPGRYTYAFFQPTELGEFRLACAEYCGDEHSNMRTMVTVHMTDDLRRGSTEWKSALWKPWKNGERLYKINCSGCHKVDGVAATGPALNLIWDKQETFTNAPPQIVDENYIKESIEDPNKKIVEGFEPKMNSFKGKLTAEDIDNLIAYIKHLKLGDPEDDGIAENAPEGEAGATDGAQPAAEDNPVNGENGNGEAGNGEAGQEPAGTAPADEDNTDG